MIDIVPPFDWQTVVVSPWRETFEMMFWIVLMGTCVGTACGWIGNFLILRRTVLIGDAISHSVLPGLAMAYLLSGSSSTWVMFLGAMASGLLTVWMIELIQRGGKIKPDAAISIAYTTLFAAGVVLIQSLNVGGGFHLDAECVLYGEIGFVPMQTPLRWNGWELGPPAVIQMLGIVLGLLVMMMIFYKELLITSFDAALARSLGFRVKRWHFGIMATLSLVVMSAFESVGAIMAVAMLIVPAMFAAQLSSHLPTRLALTVIHASLSSLLGLHLSLWLNCTTAGAMVLMGSFLFLVAWAWTALMSAWKRRRARAILGQAE